MDESYGASVGGPNSGSQPGVLVVSYLRPMPCTQRRDAAVDQRLGFRVGDDDRAGRARRQRGEDGRHQVRYATRPLQEANDFTFIVGNGEFIEGADASGDRNDNVGTPDRDDIAPFESKAGVNHDC